MIKKVGFLLLMTLSGCSGVTHVCDKRDGTCLVVFRSVSASSSVTISQLRTAHDTPVVGTTVTQMGSGVVGYIDPLAQLNTLTTEASHMQGF